MGLIKLLPWIIIAVIALVFLSRKKREREREAMQEELEAMKRKLAEQGRAASCSSPEEMVRCERCGAFFPKKEGVVKNGRLYCSRECARKDS